MSGGSPVSALSSSPVKPSTRPEGYSGPMTASNGAGASTSRLFPVSNVDRRRAIPAISSDESSPPPTVISRIDVRASSDRISSWRVVVSTSDVA